MCRALVSFSCQHNVQQWLRCQIPLGDPMCPLGDTCNHCRGHAIVKAPCFDCGGPDVYIERTHDAIHSAASSQLCEREWRTVTPDEYFLNLFSDEWHRPESAGKYVVWIPCEGCACGRHQGPCLHCDFSSHDVERCLGCTPWLSNACEHVLRQTPGPAPFPEMFCSVEDALECAPEDAWTAWARERLERRVPNTLPAPVTEEWPELPVPESCEEICESPESYHGPEYRETCDDEMFHGHEQKLRGHTLGHHGLLDCQAGTERWSSL